MSSEFLFDVEDAIASFQLTPDETGWKNATKIVNALNNWINHTQRIVDGQQT